jgi:SpoVK/Ycf46/Vps4 family AAA+-type ATPase
MFALNFKHIAVEQEVDWPALVQQTQGYSGADIASLCKEAAYMPMRKRIQEVGGYKHIEQITQAPLKPVSHSDIATAIQHVSKSVGLKDLQAYEQFAL